MAKMVKPAKQEEKKVYTDQIISYLKDSFNDAANFRNTEKKEALWETVYKSYRHIEDRSGKEAWQVSMVVPLTSKCTEIITASMYETLFGPRKFFALEPNIQKDEFTEQARMNEDLVVFDAEKGNFKMAAADALQEAVLYGTSYLKIDYARTEEMVKVRPEEDNSLISGLVNFIRPGRKSRQIEKKVLVEDFAKAKFVGIRQLYPQPGITDICRNGYIFEVAKKTTSELFQMMQDGTIDRLPEDVFNTNAGYKDSENQEKRANMGEATPKSPNVITEKQHEVKEFWGPMPYQWVYPDSSDEYKYISVAAWAMLIDDKYLAKCIANPYRDKLPPYVKFNYITVAGEWYGKGVGEQLKGVQKELNEIRNQRVDNVNLILNKQFVINSDYISEYDRVVSRPGNFIVCKQIDDVRKAIMELQVSDVTASSYRESLELERSAQEESAANRATMGTGQSEPNSTFHGQVFNRQMAMERFLYYAKRMEMSAIVPAVQMMYNRIYQYKSPDAIRQILGDERYDKYIHESPEDVAVNYACTPIGSISLQGKFQRFTALSQFETIWKGAPFINHIKIAKSQLQELGEQDPNRFVVEPESYGPGVMNEGAIPLTQRIEGGQSMTGQERQPGIGATSTPTGGESPVPLAGLS